MPQRVKSTWGEWSVLQLAAVTISPLLARVIVVSGGSVAKEAGYRLYKSGSRVSTVPATFWRARATLAYRLRRNSFACPVLKDRIMSWSLS